MGKGILEGRGLIPWGGWQHLPHGAHVNCSSEEAYSSQR